MEKSGANHRNEGVKKAKENAFLVREGKEKDSAPKVL
jgi:hypothetical protein